MKRFYTLLILLISIGVYGQGVNGDFLELTPIPTASQGIIPVGSNFQMTYNPTTGEPQWRVGAGPWTAIGGGGSASAWSTFPATQNVNMANNNLENISESRFQDTDSDTFVWGLEELNTAGYEGDFGLSHAGIVRGSLPKDGTIDQNLHLVNKVYVDAAIAGVSDNSLSETDQLLGNNDRVIDMGVIGSVSFTQSQNTLLTIDGTGAVDFPGSPPTVTPQPYQANWDGSNETPTKNDIYDEIEALRALIGGGGSAAVTWNTVVKSTSGSLLSTDISNNSNGKVLVYSSSNVEIDINDATWAIGESLVLRGIDQSITAYFNDGETGLFNDGNGTTGNQILVAAGEALVMIKLSATLILVDDGIGTISTRSFGPTYQFRMNAAGPLVSFDDTDGIDWVDGSGSAGTNYTVDAGSNLTGRAGLSNHTWANRDIASTPGYITQAVSDVIYDSEREGAMNYDITVPNGTYTINFYVSEVVSGNQSAGARVFDITAEGSVVVNDLDIWNTFGYRTRAVITATGITVSDGNLDIGFVSVTGDPTIYAIEIITE